MTTRPLFGLFAVCEYPSSTTCQDRRRKRSSSNPMSVLTPDTNAISAFVHQTTSIAVSTSSPLWAIGGGLQSPLEVTSLLMVRSVEPYWNRGFGTLELFVLSAFRIWLYLRPDIPDVDNGKEPTTLRESKYIAGETYNQGVRF